MKIMKNKRKGRRNKMGTEKETEEKVQEEQVAGIGRYREVLAYTEEVAESICQ